MGQVARQDVDHGLFDVGLRLLEVRSRCTCKDPAEECLSGQEVQSLEDLGGEHVLQAEATVTVLASVSLPRKLVKETTDSADHFATLAQRDRRTRTMPSRMLRRVTLSSDP